MENLLRESVFKDEIKEKPTFYVNVTNIDATIYDFCISMGVKKNRKIEVQEDDIDFNIVTSSHL